MLDFDGTTSRLVGNAASLSLARNINGFSVVVVAKLDTLAGGGASSYIFWQSRNDANNSARFGVGSATFVTPASGFFAGGRRNDLDTFAAAASTSDTNAHVFGGIGDYTNTTARLFVDGTNTATNSSWLTAGSTPNNDSLTSSIGFDGSTSNHFDGFVAEIALYQRALSSTERQAIERYLGRKWGITVA